MAKITATTFLLVGLLVVNVVAFAAPRMAPETHTYTVDCVMAENAEWLLNREHRARLVMARPVTDCGNGYPGYEVIWEH